MHKLSEDVNDVKAASSTVQEVQCIPKAAPISQKDVHATHSPARMTKCIASSSGHMIDSILLVGIQHIATDPLVAA